MIQLCRGIASTAASEDSMAMISTDLDLVPILQSSYSAQDIAFNPRQDAAYSPPDFQHSLSQHDNLHSIFNDSIIVSFRDKHRFLDEVYSFCSDTDLISAKNLDGISKRAGLSMEEVLAWFRDEKERRTRLFAHISDQQSGYQFPLSPARTTTPGLNATITLSTSQYTSPGTLSQIDDMFSPRESTGGDEFTDAHVLNIERAALPARARRGRPAKSRLVRPSDSSSPDSKRQKCSTKYPCPDCDQILAADRWAEHVKRVHFPEQVWECPKANPRTRKVCGSKPFFRPDNFATHLRGEHDCSAEEISQLKEAYKFRTLNLFHQICGFCEETFERREESIEHIKDHFREISERANPPTDLGASEWQEKCKSDHRLKRGVHYRISEGTDDPPSRQQGDDNGGPDQDNPGSQSHGPTQDRQDRDPSNTDTDDVGDSSVFYYYEDSNYMDYQQYSADGQNSCQKPTSDPPSSQAFDFGLEGLADSHASFVDPFILHRVFSSNPIAGQSDNPLQICPGSPELSARPAPSTLSSDSPHPSHTYLPYFSQSPFPYGLSGQSRLVSNHPSCPSLQCSDESAYLPPPYPDSPAFSHMSRSPRPNKAGSQSPYLSSEYNSYPYPPPRRPSVVSHQSYNCQGNFSSDESRDKGRCTYPECGKVFKDLKAHMLTHQNERPEKCPIHACDYHVKGFARKYDKMRHTLTHYKGTMICGFCPVSAEKSFNRADVFKRHLTSAHAVEQTPPNSRKRSPTLKNKTVSAPDASGKCSTCSANFSNAQDFYEHLDDCVLKVVQQEEPSSAAAARPEDEIDHAQYETLRNKEKSMNERGGKDLEDSEAHFASYSKSPQVTKQTNCVDSKNRAISSSQDGNIQKGYPAPSALIFEPQKTEGFPTSCPGLLF